LAAAITTGKKDKDDKFREKNKKEVIAKEVKSLQRQQ
jgi:hypothetical protein